MHTAFCFYLYCFHTSCDFWLSDIDQKPWLQLLETFGDSNEGLHITEGKLLLSQGIVAAMGWGWGICLKQPTTDKSHVQGAQTLETAAYSNVLTSTEVRGEKVK